MLFKRVGLLVLGYFLLSRLAAAFAVMPQGYAAVWSPSGLVLAALVLSNVQDLAGDFTGRVPEQHARASALWHYLGNEPGLCDGELCGTWHGGLAPGALPRHIDHLEQCAPSAT